MLDAFVAHVKRQVLSTNSTRREACAELKYLHSVVETFPDCSTIGTKVMQLFEQMYPSNGSTEPEPMPMRLACIEVHKMLEFLKTKKVRSDVTRSWQALTSYDSSDMFEKYVDVQNHLSPTGVSTTEVATKAYLKSVVEHLNRAHRMFVQIESTKDSSNVYVAAARKGQSNRVHHVAALRTDSRNPSGSRLAEQRQPSTRGTALRGGHGRGRGGPSRPSYMPDTQVAVSGRGGRSQSQSGRGRGIRGVSESRPAYEPYPTKGPPSDPAGERDLVLEAISDRYPPGYALESSKRPANAKAGLAQVRRGGCMLCLSQDHISPKCPVRDTPRAKAMYTEYCNERTRQRSD